MAFGASSAAYTTSPATSSGVMSGENPLPTNMGVSTEPGKTASRLQTGAAQFFGESFGETDEAPFRCAVGAHADAVPSVAEMLEIAMKRPFLRGIIDRVKMRA